MTVQKASIKDVNTLFELEHSVFDSFNSPLSKRSFRYHIEKNLLLTAKIDENIVGYILVLTSPKCPRIYSVAVSPSYARQGIGKALLEEVIKQSKCLRLEVRQDNQKAINLYKLYGFEIVAEKQNYYDDGCNAWEMKKVYM